MSLDNTITLISKGLRNDEFFIKVCSILDHIHEEYKLDISDVKYKLTDSTQLREDAIKEIVTELGFDYITKLMDTLTNVEFNVLIDFIALLNILKGSREGLELVLKLLGFDSIITEWWEAPGQEEGTFDITILMNTSYVPDFEKTLAKVKVLIRHYVLPKLDLIDFKYILESFMELQVNVAGFVRHKHFGRITASV